MLNSVCQIRGEEIPGFPYLTDSPSPAFFSFSFLSPVNLTDWRCREGPETGRTDGGGMDEEKQAWGGRRRCEPLTDVRPAARLLR